MNNQFCLSMGQLPWLLMLPENPGSERPPNISRKAFTESLLHKIPAGYFTPLSQSFQRLAVCIIIQSCDKRKVYPKTIPGGFVL
jgi:hypothetical protein